MTLPQGAPSGRNISIDVLKLVMAGLVVVIHTDLLRSPGAYDGLIVLDGLTRSAVPTFLVINGFYFHSMTPARLWPWVRRLGMMYVLWMAIYAPWWFPWDGLSAFSWAVVLLMGAAHLWYLSALICAGLLLFCLRKLPSKQLLVAALCLYAIGFLIEKAGAYDIFANPRLDSLLGWNRLFRNFLITAFPFLTIGFLLARHPGWPGIGTAGLAALAFCAGLALVAETALYHLILPPGQPLFPFEMFLGLLLFSPLLVLTLKSVNIERRTGALSQFATAIYLVHFIPVFVLRDNAGLSGIVLTLTTLAVSAPLAFGLLSLNRRLPVL